MCTWGGLAQYDSKEENKKLELLHDPITDRLMEKAMEQLSTEFSVAQHDAENKEKREVEMKRKLED